MPLCSEQPTQYHIVALSYSRSRLLCTLSLYVQRNLKITSWGEDNSVTCLLAFLFQKTAFAGPVHSTCQPCSIPVLSGSFKPLQLLHQYLLLSMKFQGKKSPLPVWVPNMESVFSSLFPDKYWILRCALKIVKHLKCVCLHLSYEYSPKLFFNISLPYC